ncbi:MAG TPA: glycosyltransferase family 1 protein [Gemmatimonadaceae bacterium]|nr:glycosyltransferase family 1 protein [Gemmatimonadaceae bacterium]
MRLVIDGGPSENTHRTRGIGTVARELLEALTPELGARHGFDVSYLRRRVAPSVRSHWHRRSWPAELSGAGLQLPLRLVDWWQPVDVATALTWDIQRAHADVYLAIDPRAIPVSRAYATVAFIHDFVPLLWPEKYLTQRWLGLPTALWYSRLRRLKRADWWVAVSEATKQDAVRLAGMDPDRITVAPHGVDQRLFRAIDPAAARATVAERFGVTRPYVFFAGANDPRKNLSTLLEAHDPEMADLVVVGQDAPAESPRGVHWLGTVETADLPWLYAGAVAFAFPTLYEGFGLPVLEAMACGTPVVTSKLSSIPEVTGDAAVYCDPLDARALREALHRVVNDEALRHTLRTCGLLRAARFTWSRTASLVLDACRAGAERRSRVPLAPLAHKDGGGDR